MFQSTTKEEGGGEWGRWKNSHMQIFLYIYADPASINFSVRLLPANTFFQLHTALKVIHMVQIKPVLESKRSTGEKKNKENYHFRRCLSRPRALPFSMVVLYQP